VKDRLDVVSIGIEDERGEVMTAVLRPHARRSVVRRTVMQRGFVPAGYRDLAGRSEGNVRASRDMIATRFATDRVQNEVVVVVPPEENVSVAFELAFTQYREADLSESGFVHSTTRKHVANPDADMID
jgi:hypothetical protein